MGRADSGLTVFVPFSAPGDRVRVRIVERRRRFARAEIMELLESGPDRVEPRCDSFGKCGGCAWQHLDYSSQVRAKRDIVCDALERIAGQPMREKFAFTPSPAEYGYRVRARILEESGGMGYRARSSHDLCAVEKCPVLTTNLQRELTRLRTQGSTTGPSPDLSAQTRREWEIVAGTNAISRSTRWPLADSVSDDASVPECKFQVDGRALSVSPGSFVQANGAMHDLLYRGVLEEVGSGERALELHAGIGFFTVGLRERFSQVDAVESSPSAVADLRRNLKLVKGADVRILAAPAEEVVPEQIAHAPNLVLMDPPRTGLSLQLLESVASLHPEQIVYLSCDPATLARDLARLADRGYGLRSVRGFDLFPQTPHVEVLASLAMD